MAHIEESGIGCLCAVRMGLDSRVCRKTSFQESISIYYALVSRMRDEASKCWFLELSNFVAQYSWGIRLPVCFRGRCFVHCRMCPLLSAGQRTIALVYKPQIWVFF